MRFAENLEAIADAEDESAGFRVRHHRLHRGREACDRARAQVVAVTESAGDDNALDVAESRVFMPDVPGGLTQNVRQHVIGVLITIATGKLDNSKSHWISNVYSSMTGLLRSLWQASSIFFCNSALLPPSSSISMNFPIRTSLMPLKFIDSSACLTVFPCGSSTVFFGMTII